MTKPYDQAFNITGDTGVDLNIFLGGFHASWRNTNLPVTNDNNRNIESNVNLFTSDSVVTYNNIRVCGPVMIDADTINLYNYSNFDISSLFDSFKLLNPSIANSQVKSFQPGLTTFTNVFSHSKKTKITARLFNRPVLFEAWYSHNGTSLETSKGYNSYTMFGKGETNSLPAVDMGSDPYSESTIRVYVAGIFKLHANLANVDTKDIVAGVKYINKSNSFDSTLEIVVKGVVEKVISIGQRLSSIQGILDMSLEADIVTLDTFKSNVAKITVIANGVTTTVENAVVIDQTSTAIEKKGLLDTYVVKQGFYIDTYSGNGSIDMNTGLADPIFNPNSIIEYQLVPMYTIPRATIRKPCKTCTFYITPAIDWSDPIIPIPTTPSTTPTPTPTDSSTVTPTPTSTIILQTDLIVGKVKPNKTVDITLNLSHLKPGISYNSKLYVYFDTLTNYSDLVQIDVRDFVPTSDTYTYNLTYTINSQKFINNQTICVQSLSKGFGYTSSKTKCVPLSELVFYSDLTVSAVYKVAGLTGDYTDYTINMTSLVTGGRYVIELYGYFNYSFDNTRDISDTYLISRFPYIATGETYLLSDRCLIDSMRTMELNKGRDVDTFCIHSRINYTKQESNNWVEKYTSTDSECVPLVPITTPTPSTQLPVFYSDLIVSKVKPNKTIDIIVKLFLLKPGETYTSTLYVYFDSLINFSDLIEIHTREFIPTTNSYIYTLTYTIDNQRFIDNESICVHSINAGLGFTSVKTKCIPLDGITTPTTTYTPSTTPTPSTTLTPTITATPTPTTTFLPPDTFIGTQCSGFNKVEIYADGEGGTYSEIIETNSIDCGYKEELLFYADLTATDIYEKDNATGDYTDYTITLTSLVVGGRYIIELYGYFEQGETNHDYTIMHAQYLATDETYVLPNSCLIDDMRNIEISRNRSINTLCLYLRVSYVSWELINPGQYNWVTKYIATDTACITIPVITTTTPITTSTPTPTPTPTVTETPETTITPTPTITLTETPTPTESPSPTPTSTSTGTPTPTPTGNPICKPQVIKIFRWNELQDPQPIDEPCGPNVLIKLPIDLFPTLGA